MDQPFQMLVSSIDYNEFVGRIAIGRIERGTLKQNQEIVVCNYHDPEAVLRKAKSHRHLRVRRPWPGSRSTESTAGNIIAMSGIRRHHHRRHHLRPGLRGGRCPS